MALKRGIFLYWSVQLISWTSFTILLGMAKFIVDDFDWFTIYQLLFLLFLLIVTSNSIRVAYIKLNWFSLPIGKQIPRVLSFIVLISTVLFTVFSSFNHFLADEPFSPPMEFFVNVSLYSIFLILWAAVYLTYHLFQKSRDQEIKNLKLQTSQKESELKVLRDQLNPHFLFNSLNNIRALIEIDPVKAKSTITTLSSLLRNSLNLSRKVFTSLEEELNLCEEYLKLEKVRYEERLEYEIVNDTQGKVYIPPFLVQSMTENAIKHGISTSVNKGTIKIHIFFHENRLVMEVRNSGVYSSNATSGIGTVNTRKRLQLIYGADAQFEIRNNSNNKEVIAQVWINIDKLNNIQRYESDNN